MKIYRIAVIHYYNEDEYEIEGQAPWEIADGIDKAFQESEIRPDFNKEYSHFSLVGDDVAGGVMHNWSTDDDTMIAEYSFDVAVKPQYRGNLRIGIRLIEQAINNYDQGKHVYEDMGYDCQIKLWVINPKLRDFLVKNMGFDIESDYADGRAHLVRY